MASTSLTPPSVEPTLSADLGQQAFRNSSGLSDSDHEAVSGEEEGDANQEVGMTSLPDGGMYPHNLTHDNPTPSLVQTVPC